MDFEDRHPGVSSLLVGGLAMVLFGAFVVAREFWLFGGLFLAIGASFLVSYCSMLADHWAKNKEENSQ